MRTYCNPLYVEDYPRGIGGESDRECTADYRSLADPEVIRWNGKWYMFPTYRLAYVSDDMVHWRNLPIEPNDVGPAPTVMLYKGRCYLSGGDGPLYVGNTPEGPFHSLGFFRLPDGRATKLRDTMLFADDDGRVYLFWGLGKEGIYGVELSTDNLTQMLHQPKQLIAFHPEHTWERFGEYNQSYGQTYLEGAYLLKERGRYYLVYSVPGTCYGTYCLAAYVSDVGPLEGFICQKRNPILFGKNGLVRGPGHGSFTHDADGSLWCYYTMVLCHHHKYERRIGMDRAGIDEHGELYVEGPTSIPQPAPGEKQHPGWLPLTVANPTRATSCAPGRDSLYAVDEHMLTWWQPAPDDPEPAITVSLRAEYLVESLRIIWRDVEMNYSAGHLPGPFRFYIDGLTHNGWTILLDSCSNRTDVNCFYAPCRPTVCSHVRLHILSWPPGIKPGVIDFTAFGVFVQDES